MSTIFDDVQSGSSSTASPEEWVIKYGDTPILGDNDWWFNHTLYDYVFDKGVGWPPYGIIVAPEGKDHLVWFDASSRLHVIDLTIIPHGVDLAIAVKQPEYFSDPQYLELFNETISKGGQGFFDNINSTLMIVLGIGIVFVVLPKLKK
jgi:hypothetical protein